MDIIRINVPTFIRLLELAREEIKNDPDLHDIAEIALKLSKEDIISMSDYDAILSYMKNQGNDQDEASQDPRYEQQLSRIRELGGM